MGDGARAVGADAARDRFAQQRRQRAAGRRDSRVEPLRVDGLGWEPEGVPRGRGDQHGRRRARSPVGLEEAAQGGDVRLQGPFGSGRRILGPDRIEERGHGDWPPQPQDEACEQRTLLGGSEVKCEPSVAHDGRAEDLDLHARRIGPDRGRLAGPRDGAAE